MAQEEEGTNQKSGGSKKGVLIGVFGGIIIVMLAVIIVLLLRNGGGTNEPAPLAADGTPEPSRRPTVMTQDNAEEVAEALFSDETENENIPPRYIVTMNSTWHFDDGTSPSDNAYVENDAENTTPVYFDLIRNDTEEVIYASPVIPLGESLRNFALDVDLDPGSYECTVTYHLIDDDQNTLTTVNMWAMVVVDN